MGVSGFPPYCSAWMRLAPFLAAVSAGAAATMSPVARNWRRSTRTGAESGSEEPAGAEAESRFSAGASGLMMGEGAAVPLTFCSMGMERRLRRVV